jgi:hypothetical protein
MGYSADIWHPADMEYSTDIWHLANMRHFEMYFWSIEKVNSTLQK